MKKVGHKGADMVAPGNTFESFRTALRLGVDMIEFDVLPARDGTLVLAHHPDDLLLRAPLTLEQGLEHFAGEAYAEVELNVDLKLPGYEREVVEGLRAHGLSDRALISTTYEESLAAVGELDGGIRRGWSFPRVGRDYTKTLLALPAYGVVLAWRRLLPRRAAAMLGAGRCEALMAHWLMVTPSLVRSVREAGGQLYVWTVDDRRRIDRLAALGVDAVITNDPRLFEPAAAGGASH